MGGMELRIKIFQLSRKLKLKLNVAKYADFESVSKPPDLLNKKLRYSQGNIDTAA